MSFPQSYLTDILINVWYAVPIEQASFPNEWRCTDHTREDQSDKTLGGQGGGQRTSDTPSAKGGYGQAVGGTNRQNNYEQGGFGGGQGFTPYTCHDNDSFGNRRMHNQQQGGPPYHGGGSRRDWMVG
jgi:hypothetical protein